MNAETRTDTLIAALDRTLAAHKSFTASRQIFLLAQKGFTAAADEYANATAELRRVTEIFKGQPL
jgi:hypothetical protein